MEAFPNTEIKKVIFLESDFFLVTYKGVSFHIGCFDIPAKSIDLEVFVNGSLMDKREIADFLQLAREMDKILKEYDDVS